MTGSSGRLAAAEAYLEGLINHERSPSYRNARLDLGPVRRLLDALGAPERRLAVLHIAGSKGKGSTALLAEALLRALDQRTGVFTSPHLESWVERFRLDALPVEGERLADAVERVRPAIEAIRATDPALTPTFFDATTAVAFLLFAEAAVDRAVIEVGLGGRLDSTNVVAPQVTCITSIELEHTDKLGNTLAAIAGEKAGILKPGVPAVVGALPGEALAVVRARADEVGAPLALLGRDFEVGSRPAEGEDPCGLDLVYRERGGGELSVRLPLLGEPHAHNAALALACVGRWLSLDRDRLAEAAKRGFAAARLPGRIEVVGRRPWRVVDAAHTARSARALGKALARLPAARREAVLSVSAGKDLEALLEALVPGLDRLTLTRVDPRRSLAPAEVAVVARRVAPALEVRVVPNPHLALRAAREAAGPEDLVFAAGSVYLAGLARRVLGEESAAPVRVSRRSPDGVSGPRPPR